MKLTPMLQQYLDVKARYPDAILFFRLGDFYEMFFEDAQVVAREVGLTLTARSKGPDAVPMAGMPYHSSQTYITQLIEKGFSVAICEQIEDPKDASGIVKRDVVRVVTPGVQHDSENLDARAPNYLAAAFFSPEATASSPVGLAYLDVTTGDFRATELRDLGELLSELDRAEARELLVPESGHALLLPHVERLGGVFLRPRTPDAFALDALRERLGAGVRLADDLAADGYFLSADDIDVFFKSARDFGFMSPGLIEGAISALLNYLIDTQRGVSSIIQRLSPYRAHSFLVIDESTKANLELTQTLMGGKRTGSLLSIIDRTMTAMGGRRLRHWLNYPLVDPKRIGERLDAVEHLVRSPALRADLRQALDEVYDIERLCGRVSAGTANARDLKSLHATLALIPGIARLLTGTPAPLIQALATRLDPCTELCAHIARALVDEPPTQLTEGGLFKKGYHAELDELLDLSNNGKDWMLRFEREERERTGISSLKIKYNKVFGYYIEVTRANLDLVPERYIRKQTLANAERYFVPELKEQEERILGANDRRKTLEYQLFERLRHEVGTHLGRLLKSADMLADLDVLSGLAELAQRRDYTRPTLDHGTLLQIEDGRHPVVETTLEAGERFVPNSVTIDSAGGRLLLITGPNMAGKSTIIRQVALITLLAQMGSFVPAKRAHIGVVDKLFSRVGASDNLARGQSTFMVEMTETAHILNNATERSLIILDEIGRGTATFDGLSIAWAVAEHLHDTIRARTMFATHYHELTELVRTLDGVVNLSVAVKEWQEDIIFLRKLVEGQANRSYGVQVGRLAGLPPAVVERATRVLENLEAGQFDEMGLPTPGRDPESSPRPTRRHNPDQMTLFHAGSGPELSPEERQTLERLRELDTNALTPLEALNTLHALVQTLSEGAR
ncbi:DNA mismatch repair protein MutS [Lujinxingia litoralis]|uniref:DNA mismatch repair protein MutS n=1 Tax=Lujinxingia litoralis TaxID=2211119 RepID=A0A328C5R3_9DELT|nr:DNA mismatch repair protein MutS [Lujinxingia litoralis]RAL22829.1 DNA mismatch repair protein MutS [Lujinxingia litoralis]